MSLQRTLTWVIPGVPEAILRRCSESSVADRRAAADPAAGGRVIELSGPGLSSNSAADRGADSAADRAAEPALVFAVAADIPLTWLPGSAARALPSQPRIVRREVWHLDADGTAHARLGFDFDGVPATRLHATADLTPEPDATAGSPSSRLDYHLTLAVDVPLFGAKLERAVIAQISASFDREADVIAHAMKEE